MRLFLDPVLWVEWVMLSALLAVGLYVSYTDLTVRRVPNRYTFALLVVGLAGQLLMVLLEVTTLSRVIALLVLGLVIAFGLTLVGLWAPGDAKLFWAGVVALPPTLCPSLDPFSLQAAPGALVLNALLCYLVFLLLIPLWRGEWKKEEEEDRPGGRQWLQAAVGLAGLLGWVVGLAWLVLERPLSYLEVLAALMIGYRLLERGLEVRYWPVVLWPGIVSLLYLGWATGGGRIYPLIWGVVWVLEVVYQQVRHRYNRAFVQVVPVRLVQAGAIPRQSVQVKEEGSRRVCITGEEEDNRSEPVCQRGQALTEEQVTRLRELGRQGLLPLSDRLEVEQALPFVPFIVGAAVLTAVFAGNLVPPLVMLVGWLGG